MVILKKEIVKPKKQILHGHTTIELKNVKTGNRERIEHDNTFTTAMDLFLRGNGSWNQSPWLNATWKSVPIYQRLLGGVYLFRDTIADNDGVYPHFMPASNKMIANGSFGVGNATAVTELGTYNVNESYFTASAMSFVYDWTTGQGNGDFQCVCLGSDVGGYIGYGNKTSNVAHPTLKSIIENQEASPLSCGAINDFDGYQGTISGTLLTLTKSADVFQGSIDVFPSGLNTIAIEIPTNKIAGDALKIWRCIGNGKIAVYPKYFNEGSVYCGIYDISTQTWVWHEMTGSGSFDLEYQSYVSENGFFYVNSSNHSDNFFYKFEVDPTQDTKAQALLTALDVPCAEIMPNFWYGNGYLYNAVDDTLSRCNGENINYALISPVNIYPVSLDCFRVLTGSGTEYTRQYHNPLYLATVNNLDSSIHKDQNTAMKLTYTITKETEGE